MMSRKIEVAEPDPGVRASACGCARRRSELISVMIDPLDDLNRGVSRSAACVRLVKSAETKLKAQIALKQETPVGRIAQRLIGEGLDRHNAIHAIGMVLAEHMYDVLKTTKSDKDPNAPYFAALERLTAEDWRRSQ
jgi:hypothetical protein